MSILDKSDHGIRDFMCMFIAPYKCVIPMLCLYVPESQYPSPDTSPYPPEDFLQNTSTTRYRTFELIWIFPGAPETFNGADGNIQSNFYRLCRYTVRRC